MNISKNAKLYCAMGLSALTGLGMGKAMTVAQKNMSCQVKCQHALERSLTPSIEKILLPKNKLSGKDTLTKDTLLKDTFSKEILPDRILKADTLDLSKHFIARKN